MFRKTLFIFSAIVVAQLCHSATAEAGPLLDWLFHRNRCCRPVRAFRPVAPAPSCGTCTTTCQQTCQRVVVNYVPYTAYRASWERVPVTTYRRTSSTDPCTGCTVTCNRPCTSYSWRMKQEPYTTYRPVYRTETYRVPVTYTTQAPAYTAGPACNTCQLPAQPQYAQAPVQQQQPYYQNSPTPAAGQGRVTYEPMPATGTTVPAERAPTLNKPPIQNGASFNQIPGQIRSQTSSTYSPIQDPNPGARWNSSQAPQLLNPFNKSASAAPAVERWKYSPVRLASYQEPVAQDNPPQQIQSSSSNEYTGQLQRTKVQTDVRKPAAAKRVNDGWRRD